MKEFKIKKLLMKNFKGMKDFVFDADGQNIIVEGRNDSGKTTLFDSFTWLLFGKDSLNRSNFEIKALDENGEIANHGIEHIVEGHFLIDGEDLILKRIFKEEWTKKHGESKKKFTGNTTKYYVNEEPVKKKDFTEKVNSIMSEETFKLLTNPLYFNDFLSANEQRETLIEIAGDIKNEDVAKGNEAFEKFIDELKGRSFDGYKKIINEKRRDLNKEIDTIPIRIDEIHIALPDVKGLDRNVLEKQNEQYSVEIERLNEEINSIRNGSMINTKKQELSGIDLKISELKNSHGRESNDKINKVKLGIQENESNILLLNQSIDSEKSKMSYQKEQIKIIEDGIMSLRLAWTEKKNEQIDLHVEDTCPTCSQDLPAAQVEDAKHKAQENFNVKKSEELENIQADAIREKAKVDELKKGIDDSTKKVENFEETIKKAKNELEKMYKDLENMQANVTNIEDNAEYKELMAERERVQSSIEQMISSNADSVDAVTEKIAEVKNKAELVKADLEKLDKVAQSNARLQELEEQESILNQKLEALDEQLYIATEFERKKVNLLEDKINKKFKFAKFQLFEKQINGGYKDVCKTLYKGIPYNTNLNSSKRIIVGLDIINTLAKHYQFNAPIFVDNAESIIDLMEIIELEAQTIALYVRDKDLVINSKGKEEVA